MTSDGSGITVALLHTGEHYPDDLSEDGLIYHYPQTNRPPGRDLSEIRATKTAGAFGIPLFVVTSSHPSAYLRDVRLAWIEGWDDRAAQFFVSFALQRPHALLDVPHDDERFNLTQSRPRSTTSSIARGGQAQFRFRVFQRYGPVCAVCQMALPDLLESVHIRPVEYSGSDDPRNGLVLCSNHHKAFDAGLFRIAPQTLTITAPSGGPTLRDLFVTARSLQHLNCKPHREALEWRAHHFKVPDRH